MPLNACWTCMCFFVSGKAGGFRNVGTISHLESLRATAPRFSPALPPCWNRQLGIIGLVRKSTAIHVDNCCIASGKGTMPVYLIAFEMDLVSARCRSKRGSCWGVKKQGHFVTFCYFGAPALWSILFVLWCIKRGGMLWCLFKNSMAWNLLLPRQSPLLNLLNLRCTDRLQLWWYVDFWYDICDMYVIRIYFTCTVYMRFEIKLVFLKSLWLWLSWFLKYAFLQTDLYPLFKELKNPRKKQTTKLLPHQLGSFRMDVNFQIALCISPPDRGRWENLTSPGWLQRQPLQLDNRRLRTWRTSRDEGWNDGTGRRWITEGGNAVWSPVRAWWIRYPTWCAWDGEDQKTWLKNACIHGMLMWFVRACDWFGTQRLTIQIFLFQQFHISFSGITITWGGWAGKQPQDCLFPY